MYLRALGFATCSYTDPRQMQARERGGDAVSPKGIETPNGRCLESSFYFAPLLNEPHC